MGPGIFLITSFSCILQSSFQCLQSFAEPDSPLKFSLIGLAEIIIDLVPNRSEQEHYVWDQIYDNLCQSYEAELQWTLRFREGLKALK